MNHQLVSEIFFEESFRVSSGDTARAVFGRLTNDVERSARDFHESIATCYLVALAEAACIRELSRHVDPSTEAVVGRRVDIDHRRPIAPGTLLRVSGWVEQIGERSARFFVRAADAQAEVVCEATITLYAVDRATLAARMNKRPTMSAPVDHEVPVPL